MTLDLFLSFFLCRLIFKLQFIETVDDVMAFKYQIKNKDIHAFKEEVCFILYQCYTLSVYYT